MKRAEVALGVMAGVLSIPAAYAVQRLFDVATKPQVNPATVISSAGPIAMFWRVLVGLYVAPVIAFAVYTAARRDLARTAGWVDVGAVLVAVLATAQAVFTP